MPKIQRPPIVTFLGHVDHGKTSLLDKIRETEIQKGEAGGITQSIGAYQVEHQGKLVTFVDTPGHAAFAKMRARGGKCADIVILVVACNAGVKPQTEESINHAQAAKARIIVALNKMDLTDVNPAKVKKQLSDKDILVKEYGGTIQCVETSAVTEQGLDKLLDTIIKQAAELDLSADPEKPARGIIVESMLDSQKGPIASGIVLDGSLATRDVVIAGKTYGRIKSLKDWRKNEIKQAGPATPVEILGFDQVPTVGIEFSLIEDVRKAQKLVDQIEQPAKKLSVQERLEQAWANQQAKEIPLVLKADCQGSLEAIVESILSLGSKEVKLKILHQGVGSINENDIFLAMPIKGIVIGFKIGIDKQAEILARKERIIYRTYQIIYRLLKEMEEVISGEIQSLTQQIIGEAKVKKVFELSDGSWVAGCEVLSGLVKRGHKVQILRNKEVIGESRIASLRKRKEDIGEVKEGEECGIQVKPPVEFQIGDVIQSISN